MAGTSDTPSDGLQPEPASHSPQPQQSQPPFTYPAREAGVADPENLNRSGWLSILEQDESDTARNYQPAHRQEYGGLHYDPDFILAPRTDPRALPSSESWLSYSQRHTQRVLAHPLPISLADMSGSSEPKNIGNIPTDLIPPPSRGPGEAQAGVSTRQDEHSQLSQISTPAPKTNTIDQLGDTALSAVSSSSNLPSHASDSKSWISSTDLAPFSKKKEMAWAVCSCITTLLKIIWGLLHAITTSVYPLTQWTLSRSLPFIATATRSGWVSTRAPISKRPLQI